MGHLPTIFSESLGDIFMSLDTSGSMSDTDLAEGISEFRGIRQTQPFPLHYLCCDAQVYTVHSYDKHEEPDWASMKIEGGGGTSFVPVFTMIEEWKEEKGTKPTLLVFFTDGYGDFPSEEPDYPVIWVCSRGGLDSERFPFGEVIRMD